MQLYPSQEAFLNALVSLEHYNSINSPSAVYFKGFIDAFINDPMSKKQLDHLRINGAVDSKNQITSKGKEIVQKKSYHLSDKNLGIVVVTHVTDAINRGILENTFQFLNPHNLLPLCVATFNSMVTKDVVPTQPVIDACKLIVELYDVEQPVVVHDNYEVVEEVTAVPNEETVVAKKTRKKKEVTV